ncbi:MAG: formate dehydrogenase subunit alpha [Proteobacteria bacterium]|nr:formate dehydrogenase subunit alpha [Pseudomonadota bacterium]MBU1965612.1 formate dehydrogenase subunit alpha [Pseudomonadota bacterium]
MKEINLVIDGRAGTAPEGATVLEAIQQSGHYVPTLCHDPVLKPFGGCRLCIVRIDGVRGLPTACTTPAEEGMVIHTEDDEIRTLRRTIVELAIANHPSGCLVCSTNQECELLKVARYVGVRQSSVERLRRGRLTKNPDTSNPAYDFDPNKCILCGRCVRTCDELVGLGAIDFAHRGYDTVIAPFGAQPLALSVCQTCGECVEHCPTGALTAKQFLAAQKEVKTVCPYCGVGCAVYLGVRGQNIVHVRGDDESPVNRGELCVKGRFGLDFVNHPDRLSRPLIRKPGVPKDVHPFILSDVFREADWDEALAIVAERLKLVHDHQGPDLIGVLSSAKCTNEDNYVFQKFARAVLGTNNVDHCARLCHASTVTAALAAFGEGAMSNSISDVDHADVFLVIGSNTTECHPIIGRRIKRAIKNNGAKLIVADPRAIELSEMAEVHLSQFPGTDVALLNGIMRQIVDEGLHDQVFISERSEDFEPFLSSLQQYDLKTVEEITGVPREKIRQAAMLFGKAERAMVLYGMGITQHTTGTDNVKAIANLLMLTGNIGRQGTGFAPLRGQNNVQGACDMGALPVFYPGYQRVDNPGVRERYEKAWGKRLNEKPGLTVTEMIQGAHAGSLKALYVMGENPMLSEPDLNHAKEAFSKLELLIVQDIFCTETAQMADVILPATSFAEKDGTFTSTERRVQLVRKAIDPPGQARMDWEIITEISCRMGYPLHYESSAEIMAEICRLTPIYGGITHERLTNDGGLQWPCWDREHLGTPRLHAGQFTRGRGKFHVVQDRPPAELPTVAYPMLLSTGRILEQFHTGSMSHRSRVLEALAAESRVEINPEDARRLGIGEGDLVSLSSRRGEVQTKVKMTHRIPPGHAFMAFHWGDAPANRLTITAVDPQAKIPEFKVSSIKAILTVLEKGAEDNKFLTALAENPAGVLSSYDLTPEHRKALVNGDIASIENWIGPLDQRLKTWLTQRLKQENLASG